MELADYHWLTSDAALPWLARAQADTRPPLQAATALRADLSPERTHLVLEQVELRRRATAKFPQADLLFFTRKGLEQATDLWVARYKAARHAVGTAAADLCCGIGGDLLALAERGPVLAVDRDPVAALLARANAEAWGRGQTVTVLNEEIRPDMLDARAHWHIDPDRRPQGKRVTGLDWIEPPLAILEELLKRNPRASIKLAPATDLEQAQALPAVWEWISRAGECRQLVAWCNADDAAPGTRLATVLDREDNVLRQLRGEPRFVPTGPVGRWVYEPDAAILAAKLEGLMAEELGLHPLGGGYLTGDAEHRDAGLQAFEVLEVLPFDRKRMVAWLAERNVGTVEVKSRDGRSDANRLQRELSSRGTERVTLLLAPLGKRTLAIMARRVEPISASGAALSDA